MRACHPATVLFGLLGFVVACSGSSAGAIASGPDQPVVGTGEPTGEQVTTPDDPDGPHALGTVVLGETHATGAGAPRGIVGVAFVPDAAAAAACTKPVAGCALAVPCGGAAPPAAGFDAGPVAIAGARTPLTLYPPYAVDPGAGVPFAAGAELRVQAAGAATVGFEAFDETFRATRPIVAEPALSELPGSGLWGTASVPVTWAAGPDAVRITVTGNGGTLSCAADDAKGRFDVPREVIVTALGKGTSLALSLARERTETKRGLRTKGPVPNRAGWLALTTTSIETASFTCSGAECTGGPPKTSCQDCRTSLCKTEFDACSADATCPMLRTCLDDCTDAACRGACLVKWPDPVAKAKNGALFKCQCTTSCATECAADCH
jgi:hypothetical protein